MRPAQIRPAFGAGAEYYASSFLMLQIAGPPIGDPAMPMTNHDLYRRALAFLVDARNAQGMKPGDVAAKLGVAEEFVAEYETGRWRLDPGEYVAIARAVGVDPYELLQRAEEEAG
jgi:ribosome-binding protein aMBF1 (putative translation factor)